MLKKTKREDAALSVVFFVTMVVFWLVLMSSAPAASAGSPKAKFYDFSEQLINGEIKKPTTLYTNARERVKFEGLLTLKKSFLQPLLDTGRENIFR